ncbi:MULTISPECIES: hypothetical protein [unclassified Streptomyces]|uniref:hypothetical protein n=1 Tax=unclassified Streptomyces TaxID=2593676 RepID=UPI00081F5D65|nr:MULTISPECIES: hypothetical protein [unclassified Streptomyces]MYR26580.1 hypothetical protein [Streptomyces sp. SID4945]SCF06682.1 hypothetical protein GA0115257_10659 [Streptomyces sp. LcepLS]
MPVPSRQLGATARSESAPPSACPTCRRLRAEEREAVARGDHSRATDCRVLIARHPHEGAAR